MRRDTHANSQFDGMAVEDRQDARHRHADWADVFIGAAREGGRAPAEKFGFGQQMSMDFESDYSFVRISRHASIPQRSAAWRVTAPVRSNASPARRIASSPNGG